MTPPQKKVRLHRDAIEKVSEKYIDPAEFSERRTLITREELLNPMMLSKACSRAFFHSFRISFRMYITDWDGWIDCRNSAPLNQMGRRDSFSIPSKWTAAWMLEKGLVTRMEICLETDRGTPMPTQPDESQMESYARLILTEERDLKMLKLKSLAKQVALPSVDYFELIKRDPSSYTVPWSMINQMFNLNPESIYFCPLSATLDATDSTLNENILADATKKVHYRKIFSYRSNDFDTFELLSPWKKLLLHTCCVCPNLKKLHLSFSWDYLYWLAPPDPDRLDRHFEQLEKFINWILDDLLPEMEDDSRFDLRLCFGSTSPDQFIPRVEELAEQMNFIPIEEDGRWLKMRSTDDSRFEIHCASL